MPRIQSRLGESLEHPLRQHGIEVPDANSFAIHLLQESGGLIGQERLLYRCLQPGELLRLLNFDRSLLKSHHHPQDCTRKDCTQNSTRRPARTRFKSLERETGIEPATNSLEGCDSTTELLPLETSSQLSAVSFTSAANAALPFRL